MHPLLTPFPPTVKELVNDYIKCIKELNSDLSEAITLDELLRATKYSIIACKKILEEQPSRRYWDTYADEEPSAITLWKEHQISLMKLENVILNDLKKCQ